MPRWLPPARDWPRWQERLVAMTPTELWRADPESPLGLPRLAIWAFMEWRRVGANQTEDLTATFWKERHGPLDWKSLSESEASPAPSGHRGPQPSLAGFLALLAYRVQVQRSIRFQHNPAALFQHDLRLRHTLTHDWPTPTEHLPAMVATVRWLLGKPDLNATEKRVLAGETMSLWLTSSPFSSATAVSAWKSWTQAFAQLPIKSRWDLLNAVVKHEWRVTWGNGTDGGLSPQMDTSTVENWYQGYRQLLDEAAQANLTMTPRQLDLHLRLMNCQLNHCISQSMWSGSTARPSAAGHAGPILARLHAQGPAQVPLDDWARRYASTDDGDTAAQLSQLEAKHQAQARHTAAEGRPLAPSARPRIRS